MTFGIVPPRYRLPATTRLGAVTLQVSDLARSLAYYEGVLGFSVLARETGGAILAAAGEARGLVNLRAKPGARSVPRRGHLGLYHFAILLPDRPSLGRFVAHLGARGIQAASADHAVSEALYLWDPDGLGIEVYADRPRETWRLRDGELYMTVEPLNLPDLLESAGRTVWTGMPAGTVLGHVHLHVGDLDAAAGFYHAALGFDKTAWSYYGALFLSAGGYHHHLGTNTWATGAAPAGPDDARLIEWEILLPSPEACVQAGDSLLESGYGVTADGDARTAADPWGTTVRLLSA